MKCFLLIFVLLAFVSCGPKKAKEEEVPLLGNSNDIQWSQPIKPRKQYDEGEMKVAKNVCQSFQQKRATLSALGGVLNLDFSVKTKECLINGETVRPATGVMTSSRAGEIRLESQTRGVTLFTDVISDNHPRIKGFCSSVLSGVAPDNTVQDGLIRYQVNFFQAAGFEWVQIAEFVEVRGQYYPSIVDRVAVVTDYSALKKDAYGFVKYRTLNRPCAGSNVGNYVMQEWL
ncbi:MAG: hypothetical protein K9K67_07020 [Bacteriovoracaceae bacterium]|nr:hypothetical protein [Bacteriovoracaceae bacterium]